MHEEARAYLNLGWSLLPIKPGAKTPLGKLLPVGEDGRPTWIPFQTTPPLIDDVERWLENEPSMNIGVVCGAVSGIIVLDQDGDQGAHSLKYRDIPDTVRARTPHGWHHYFRHPGFTVSNRAGLLPNVDVRGDGGYVVAPPSHGPDGNESYYWVRDPFDYPLADAPDWLLDMLRGSEKSGARVAVDAYAAGMDPDAQQARGDWLHETLGGVEQGRRNMEMTRLAGRYLGMGSMSVEEVTHILLAINQTTFRPPLDESEVRTIVASIARREKRKLAAMGLPPVIGRGSQPALPPFPGVPVEPALAQVPAPALTAVDEPPQAGVASERNAAIAALDNVAQVAAETPNVPAPTPQVAQAGAAAESCDEPEMSADERQALLDDLSDALGFRIVSMVCYMTSPPTFVMETEKGRIELGNAQGILSYDRFRVSVASMTRKVIRVQRKYWDAWAQQLLNACVVENVTHDATWLGGLEVALATYFAQRCPAISDGWTDNEWREQAVRYGPFIIGDKVYIHTYDLHHVMKLTRGDNTPREHYAVLLRAFGAKPRRVNAGNGRNRRSREYWELDVHRAPIPEEYLGGSDDEDDLPALPGDTDV